MAGNKGANYGKTYVMKKFPRAQKRPIGPANCAHCGSTFLKKNWNHKYCEKCGPKIEIETNRKRSREYYQINRERLIEQHKQYREREANSCSC
jgi:ribosomal protein S27AE